MYTKESDLESKVSQRLNGISVLHLSPTPLVGAPSRLAAAQRVAGIRAECAIIADYPKLLAGNFIDDAIPWFTGGTSVELTERLVKNADIIHVHNDLPVELAWRFLNIAPAAKWIYHAHSPMREGPLFARRDVALPLPFSAKLVVAQYQPRVYPDFLPVPNLVNAFPSCSERRAGERLRVLFSPTHARGGRWNDKGSEKTSAVLSALANEGHIDFIIPSHPLPPASLMSLRRSTHVSIDEVTTGAFHLNSLEGLCVGNVVINGADFFSQLSLMSSIGSNERAPFRRAGLDNLKDCLLELSNSVDLTGALQSAGSAYFEKWLKPSRLVSRYLAIYDHVLNRKEYVA